MKNIQLKIESISPALKKDGSTVNGVSKNGSKWQLYKINKRYSWFQHGDGEPNFRVGETYPFSLETKIEGEYTNYLLSPPKKEGEGLQILSRIEGLEARAEEQAQWIRKLLEIHPELLKKEKKTEIIDEY